MCDASTHSRRPLAGEPILRAHKSPDARRGQLKTREPWRQMRCNRKRPRCARAGDTSSAGIRATVLYTVQERGSRICFLFMFDFSYCIHSVNPTAYRYSRYCCIIPVRVSNVLSAAYNLGTVTRVRFAAISIIYNTFVYASVIRVAPAHRRPRPRSRATDVRIEPQPQRILVGCSATDGVHV